MRAASAASVWSPNIIVPSQSFETFRPLAPSGVGGWRLSAIGRSSGRRRCAGDEAVAQLALEHFADRAARQLVDDIEERRCAASCRAARWPRRAGSRRRALRLRARRPTPPASRPSARTARRRPPHRRPRVLAQHRLEVARVEVEAAADDHVLAPIDQREEAVFVEAADVAGADEALARRRRTTRPRRSSPAGRGSRPSSPPSGRRPRRSRRAAARGRARRSGGCRGLRAGWPTVCSLSGCSCAARMHVPPPSVMP